MWSTSKVFSLYFTSDSSGWSPKVCALFSLLISRIIGINILLSGQPLRLIDVIYILFIRISLSLSCIPIHIIASDTLVIFFIYCCLLYRFSLVLFENNIIKRVVDDVYWWLCYKFLWFLAIYQLLNDWMICLTNLIIIFHVKIV